MLQVNVPEGVSGEWRVEKFSISPTESMVSMFSYGSRAPSPGTYTRLMHNNTVVMSDTPAERADHYAAVRYATGHVLINGLGLGMVLLNCMVKPEVERATVIEYSQDVIALVAPHYKEKFGDKIEIIHADALEWKPPKGVRYGMVWHDIWTYICTDNYDDMKLLHRRYGRKADWQGSWSRPEVERLIKEENKQNQYYW